MQHDPENETARHGGDQRAGADSQILQNNTVTNYRFLQGRIRCHGKAIIADCPCCGYKGALSVTEKNGKRLFCCHAGCAQADLWAVVREAEGNTNWQPARYAKARPAESGLDDYMRRLWDSSQPAKGTLVERYLPARGIVCDIPPSLRFLPRHKHRPTETFWPVMLAAVTDYSGNLRALHRTYLATDGKDKAPVKPPRMTLGPVEGCAAHLGKAGERLAVSEGLENGLSAMVASGIPTWAALSAGGIEKLILPPLPLAREVLICADNDPHGVGQRAADKAAARWYAEGRDVRIATPSQTGKDLNDLLREVPS